MTSGSLWKNILLFSLPLMGSQVLEVLFNLSDVAVVGRFADYLALGAVGSTTLLVTLFTGILIGMGAGVNVRVAHELGAGNRKGTEETIHTSLLLCAIAGLLVCIICLLFSGQMLAMMNTKPELIDQAVLYMKIYALGMPAMAVYNFGNGVLSARGDTKRPLIYLSIAGVINVLLNLFFVIVCHMAAAGVATASAISLYVSAFLVMSHLLRRTDDCKVSLRKIRLHPKACKAVLLLGIPTGLQNGIFAIANLFVQAGVNSFDAVMVSGNAAAANADSLIYNVMFAFYTACASFIGQNWGAGNQKRMLKSYGISITYAFISGAILGGLLLAGSSCRCLLQNRLLSMQVCRGSGSWASAMPSAVLWMAASLLPVASEKVSLPPLSSSWDPVYSVSSGSTRCSHISRRYPRCIFFISSHGGSPDLRKLFSLLSASKKYVHNERNSSPLLMVGVLLLKDDNPA